MLSLRGTSPHPPGPNARFRILRYLISGKYKMPSGLISTSSGSVGASRISAASLGNGSALSPWKDRVQSIFSSGDVSSSNGLSLSPVFEIFAVVGCLGVSDAICDARSVAFDVLELPAPAPAPAPVPEGEAVLELCCWYLGVVAMLRISPRAATRDVLRLTARSERMEYIFACFLAVVVVE